MPYNRDMSLKIVIPTAGWGTRLRPHTWSKPKPLIGVAGKTALDHLLDTFKTIPAGKDVEYVIIVEPYLGERQIPAYMQEHHSETNVHYVVQTVMRGQSDALWLAHEYLSGPTLVCFSDTLIETDFSFLAGEKADGVAWVKHMPDPRRFGVAEVDASGRITRLIEKPDSLENTLVVVGCYYFQEGGELVSAIEEQVKRGTTKRGEFYLVDAINILIERGARLRTQAVEVWLDTGTIEATLATNRYLLEHGRANHTKNKKQKDMEIIPPAFVHASAEIKHSVVGPYASIGPGCKVTASRIEDSILEDGATVEAAALKGSFIGRRARVQGRSADDPPLAVNIGDDSSIQFQEL
jgi:glucose-1-phosphate thymidylyltransferase